MTLQEDLKKAVETMRKGGIILYPTDTVWGIGCDATNEEAVKKIFALKKRADSKSMLVLTHSEEALASIVEDVPEVALELIRTATDPVTVIYDRAFGVAPSLLAEDGSLGVRVTRENFSRELCRMLGCPVVSTSANVSGEPSPRFFNEISGEILQGVDYVAEHRRDDTTLRRPSNIIKIGKGGLFKILR